MALTKWQKKAAKAQYPRVQPKYIKERNAKNRLKKSQPGHKQPLYQTAKTAPQKRQHAQQHKNVSQFLGLLWEEAHSRMQV